MGLKARLAVTACVAGSVLSTVVGRFYMPSGGMLPTLPINEPFTFSWVAYGLQLPGGSWLWRRDTPHVGDVILFTAPPSVPANPGEDWTKRVIAVGGDKVAFRGAVFYVNDAAFAQSAPDGSVAVGDDGAVIGEVVEYDEFDPAQGWSKEQAALKIERVVGADGVVVEHQIFNDVPVRLMQFPVKGAVPRLPGLQCSDEFCVVDDGYVFVAGDNRDHSSDSRAWGAVPVDNVRARLW